MIRVAAVGDVHVGADAAGVLRAGFADIADHADLLLLAGDLTRTGDRPEIAVAAGGLRDLPVPVFAVLGNHDHHRDHGGEMAGRLREAGVTLLEGDAATVRVRGLTVGVAGVTGFGGGFRGASGAEFGKPEQRAYMRHSRERAEALEEALRGLGGRCDLRIALAHYAPVPDTVVGEPPEIHPWLGTHRLAEAIDRGGAALAVHRHAHHGTEKGVAAGGVRVRNVAQPPIRSPYRIYQLPEDLLPDGSRTARSGSVVQGASASAARRSASSA